MFIFVFMLKLPSSNLPENQQGAPRLKSDNRHFSLSIQVYSYSLICFEGWLHVYTCQYVYSKYYLPIVDGAIVIAFRFDGFGA